MYNIHLTEFRFIELVRFRIAEVFFFEIENSLRSNSIGEQRNGMKLYRMSELANSDGLSLFTDSN